MIPNIMNPLGVEEHWPLTLQALEDSTVKMAVSQGSPTVSGLKYRKKFQQWAPYTVDDTISLKAGQWVQFMNQASTLSSSGNTVKFSLTGKLTAFGDLMSMLNASGCASYCFTNIFGSNNTLYSCKNIKFPLNLATGCLQSAFAWCQYMYEGPQVLPATTLASACYSYMFQGDTRLQKMARIPATQYSGWCCQYMYSYCGSSLTNGMQTVPILAESFGTASCGNMFSNARINKLEVSFTQWSASTTNWVSGVPASVNSVTGTFIKPQVLASETGADKIPFGWNIVNK